MKNKIGRIVLMLMVLFMAVPAQAAVVSSSSLGESHGVQVKPLRTQEKDLQQIAGFGIKYVRFGIQWWAVEAAQGHYDWSVFDSFIENARTHNFKMIILLRGGNKFYMPLVPISPKKPTYMEPAAPNDDARVESFAAFAAAAVARYGSNDIVWEIWNEPDLSTFWPPEPDAEAFAKTAKAACRAMREVAPQAKIVAPGLAFIPLPSKPERADFLATLLASPAASCLDAISIHPYRRGAQPPETALTDYEEVRAFIAAHTPRGQKPLPIISSEWGYSLTETTPEQQAAYAVRMPLVNALAGVPLGNWYEWKDSRQGALNREAHFGLLDYQGDDKFSAETVKDLWPQMANAVVVKRVPVAETDSFVLLLRQPDGRLQLAAWQGVARLVKEVVLQVEEEGAARAFPLTLFPRLIDLKTTEPELPKNLRVSTVSAGAENLRP